MPDGSDIRITIADNGPYRITGGAPLTRRAQAESVHGEPLDWDLVGDTDADYEVSEGYTLCRCGKSSNKPFCDATHRNIDFDGSLTADRGPGSARRKTMAGVGVVMTDDPTICEDAGFCGTRYINVWKMILRTRDPEVRERLKRMIHNCPSGRLEYSLELDGEAIEPEYDPSIATIENGPLWIRGGIAIEAADGFTFEIKNRVTLCRCGHSKNKPFCDGAHKAAGFEAT